MTKNFIFRKADITDAEKLVGLCHELNLYHGVNEKPDCKKLTQYWDYFSVFVVATEEEIVGFLSGYESFQFHLAILGFELQNLYVKENYRKMGVGKMLMQKVIAIKYHEGVERFALGAQLDNHAAREFYQNLGFHERAQDHARYVLTGDKLKKFVSTTSTL
ncbi:MAG: GNAT family N-acetyltransferase [Alphaproteobacteria bacterium]